MIKDLSTHPEKFVTVAELAEYWRVSDRAVRYWIAKGALKADRLSKSPGIRTLRVLTRDAIAFGRIDEPTTGPIASV